MRKRLRFSRKALSDLDRIWVYTEQHWGADQARHYTAEIRDECRRLIEGQAVPAVHMLGDMPLLRLRSGSHFVFLRDAKEGLVVIRILHVRQDPSRALD